MRAPSLVRLLSAGLATATFAACAGESTSIARVACSTDADCPGSTCEGGFCADTPDATTPDADDPTDTPSSDLGTDTGGDVSQDVDTDDVDVTSPDGTVEPGEFGDPCVEDAECRSGVCINTGDQSVCTTPCTDACPDPEWECRLITGSGGDVARLCVPPADLLCEPCTRNVDCGSAGNLCVELPDGSFCGLACEQPSDCPSGFECVGASAGGISGQQCLPTIGVCSGCYDEDGDLHGLGETCLGADCDETSTVIYAGAPELCDGNDNDCDGAIDEGFDLTRDPRNCGACGNLCDLPNAASTCSGSQCVVEECVAPWDDCNVEDADGCETNTHSSVQHCGSCGNPCSVLDGVGACDEGTCRIASCNTGFANCDGRYESGCEVDTQNSITHCGRCDNACGEAPNAAGACVRGACAIVSCTGEWLDCNGTYADGCESSRLSVNSCLACGTVCEFSNAVAACSPTGCMLESCVEGFVNRDGLPENGCEYECTVSNGGVEICDGLDNDCDGDVDEGAIDAIVRFRDADADTWGDTATQIRTCAPVDGYVERGGDCNDANSAINPGAAEICNGIDDNCAGGIDEGLSVDADRDGRFRIGSCALPADDCDDSDPFNFPGNVEVCDGRDNNCDSIVDPINATGCTNYWVDGDRDGFGAGGAQCLCAPSGTRDATRDGDCFDGNANARPGQTAYFAANRGDGSWDYDCNSSNDRRWTAIAGACEFTLNICSNPGDGYTSGVPNCGASGTWASGCSFEFDPFGGSVGCRRSSTSSRTQECR